MSWKQAVIEAGLNPRKELFFGILLIVPFLLGAMAIYFFLGPSFYLVLPFLLYLFFLYLYLGRYKSVLAKREGALTDEFVKLFTFFGVYIEDGYNVYSALQAIQGFASPSMHRFLEDLLNDIEEDKGVTPYVRFSSHFSEIAVKQVMLSIYQRVEEGQGGVYVQQFQRLFGKLSGQEHALAEEKWIGRLSSLSFLPLAGSGLTMIALSLSLVSIMEEALNVL